MKNEKRNKTINKKNLFLSAMALCLSLFIATSVIFAWFSMNTSPKINSFTLNVNSSFISNATVNAYAVSTIIEEGSQKTYMLAINENNLVFLQNIPDFDFLGIAFNEYRACLAINITFTLINDFECAVIVNTTKGLIKIGSENWLSNCIQFVSANFNANDLSLTSYGTPKSFVTLEQDELSKIDNMEISRNNYFTGSVSLWFILEYNSDVLLKIHNENTELNDEYISYGNDIALEIKIV